MKIGPFKMKGFGGFGNDSPTKHATGVVGQGMMPQIYKNNGIQSGGFFGGGMTNMAGMGAVGSMFKPTPGGKAGQSSRGNIFGKGAINTLKNRAKGLFSRSR